MKRISFFLKGWPFHQHLFKGSSSPLCLFILFIICSLPLYVSGNPSIQVVSERLIRLKEYYPQEKLYIHTDKSHYLPGETVWFSLYLADASSHEASQHSRMVYVELTDTQGMVADRRYIAVTGGKGHGDFLLDIDFEPGSWILRGFTNFMLNYANTPLFSMELKVMGPHAGAISGYKGNASHGSSSGASPGSPESPGSVKGSSPVTGNDSRSEPALKDGADGSAGEFSPAAGLNVRFFPEGGDLVGGLAAVVAVQSAGPCGRGVEVHGQVYDDLGNPAGSFTTGRFGLGRFMFTPLPGRHYHVAVETGGMSKRFELPALLPQGYTLQVNNSMPDEVLVRVETNMDGGLQGAFLAGHIRGELFCLTELPAGDLAFINIDKIDFPPGIVHLTLFSAEGLPVAERLAFIGSEETLAHLDVSASRETYGNRERVEIELEVTDDFDYPLAGNLSVSVTDSYVVPSHHDRHNIVSYLLLSSDLPGNIENPGYFFDPFNADRHLQLDLLMMTYGWRRFRWEDLLAGKFPEIRYPAGGGHILEGKVTRKDRHDVPVRSSVMLAALGEEFSAASQVTGEDGLFLFDGIDLYDTTILVLQGSVYRERRSQRRARQEVDDSFTAGSDNWISFHLSEPEIIPGRVDIPAASIAEEVMAAYLEDSMKDPMLSHLEDIWQLEIEEVEIRYRRPVRRTTFDRAIHGTPFRPRDRVIPDQHPFSHTYNNPWELLRSFHPAIITVSESALSGPTGPRDTGPPTSVGFPKKTGVFLDGIEINDDGDPLWFLIISNLPVETISFIDILREPQTMIYGMGYSMVIAFYTKTMGDYRDAGTGPPGVLSFEFPGYYRAREFYSPFYGVPGPHHNRPDYRTTLFWDPEVHTDGNGRAKVSFFTSDKSSAFRVIVEGMTETGLPVYATGEFWVEAEANDR